MNQEWRLTTKDNYYFIDFAIPFINFYLEFYGDYWHKNPNFFNSKEDKKKQEKDKLRENNIKSENFNLYTIWEKDYKDNNIIYVGGTGVGNYTNIQDAIDISSNDDTIFVYNGTYYENIELINL